ncbi:MAG: kinase/pyrophosphorylase, partial [Mycetocola sp.]
MISSRTTAATRSAYFVSDSTGVTAETLGNALLANFPGVIFQRHTVPFVDTVSGAQNVVRDVRASAAAGLAPIVFATVKSAQIFDEIDASGAVVIDLLGGHLRELEAALGSSA